MGDENTTCRTGMMDRVRTACRRLGKKGWITRRDIYFEVDPADGDYTSFERTWQDLIERKELVRAMADIPKCRWYRYNPLAAPRSYVLEKILRAMHVKGAFCAADIHRLTDADVSYISATIRRMAKAGDLELTGKRGKTKMYRVKHPNKFYLEKIK